MLKKFIVLLFSLTLALIMAACSDTDFTVDGTSTDYPLHLAVVYAERANQPRPSWSDDVSDLIKQSAMSYGSVCLIVNDGKPFVAANYIFETPEKKLSESKYSEIVTAQVNKVLSVLDSAKAQTPEADLLSAISLAARGMSGADGTKTLLILDSGLSTCGYVNFTENLLRADPQSIVGYLAENEALPNLENVSVVWVGLGDVAAPQDTLTPSNVNALRDIWDAILKASGAIEVEFSAEPPSAATASSDIPYVTPIPVLEREPISISFEQPIILNEDKILFCPDTAVLADANAAADTLQPIASYLSKHQDFCVVLAGTTATAGTEAHCKQLSLERADAVKRLLVSQGASSGQIETVGLGYNHPYHIPDIDSYGKLNANASANRSVIIFDAESAEGQQVFSF